MDPADDHGLAVQGGVGQDSPCQVGVLGGPDGCLNGEPQPIGQRRQGVQRTATMPARTDKRREQGHREAVSEKNWFGCQKGYQRPRPLLSPLGEVPVPVV